MSVLSGPIGVRRDGRGQVLNSLTHSGIAITCKKCEEMGAESKLPPSLGYPAAVAVEHAGLGFQGKSKARAQSTLVSNELIANDLNQESAVMREWELATLVRKPARSSGKAKHASNRSII